MSAASDYLQSFDHYFWRYEDRGKVIAVPDGRTIGYTDQVINEMVFHLAPYGLPRFGSLLLAITATTAHGAEALEDIVSIVEKQAKRTEEVEKGIWFLKQLTQLPTKFKQGNLRILLLQAVFTHSHNGIGTGKSTQVVEELKADPSITLHPAAQREEALTKLRMMTQMINDFKTLAIIGEELKDVPTILKRISNLPSVTQVVEGLELEPKADEQRGTLIDRLLDHKDTFHVGALVASLISGLQVSFHASLPSEQPLGGVADITNKGSFDKLLTSEYAFDDHVLLSRLANSEALYKHREVLPADNNHARILLIDTTLKNWGNIRTISFAVALAIAHHPRNKDPYRVFLVGKSYREIAIETVVDVIDGLNTVDSTLDPGSGIEQLFTQENLRVGEIFFIGAVASVASPGMQRLVTDSGRHIDHWIHPDERGAIKVYKSRKRSKRLVQELRISLDEVWSKPQAPKSDDSLTYIINYPILFPGMKMKATWTGERFTYGVTKYKALMRLYAGQVDVTQGWELIAGEVQPKENLKAVITHEDLSVTVLYGTDTKAYTVVSYPDGERTTVALDRRMTNAKNFYVEDGRFAADLSRTTLYIDKWGQITESDTIPDRRSDKVFRNKANNFFRRLTRVYITLDHKLRIRKHDLLLENDTIRIHHRGSEPGIKLMATEKEPGVFTFPDGSFVAHNPNGILYLRSADVTLPDVYLPTQLNTPLGLATADTFSGNTYYQQKPLIELIVNDTGNQIAEVAGLVNEHLDRMDFRRAEDMAKDGLILCPDEATLAKLESMLAGYLYRVQRRGIDQRQLSPTDFYRQYIEPFIEHIEHYGTNA